MSQINLKPHEAQQDTTSHTFLTGAILFANLDYSGFTAYALKAAIGGLIWMVFKLAGEYSSYLIIENKKRKREQQKRKEEQE